MASHGFSFLALHGVMLQSGCYTSTSIIWKHFNITFIYCVSVCMTQDGLGSCIGEIAQEFSDRGEGTISICVNEYGFSLPEQGSCSKNDNWALSG